MMRRAFPAQHNMECEASDSWYGQRSPAPKLQLVIRENLDKGAKVTGHARLPDFRRANSLLNVLMSALGQKQTFRIATAMSALPPKATSIAFFGMSALGRFCCKSPLRAFLVSD